MAAQGRGIQSIEVGGRLLSVLISDPRSISLRGLANKAKIAPAQAHAYLASFRRIGLAEQDEVTGLYRIGPFAMRLGMGRMRCVAALAASRLAAEALSLKLGLMTLIVAWGPHTATVVHVQDGGEPLNLNIRQGTQFSVTGTASGRIFAAFSAEKIVSERVAAELVEGTENDSIGVRVGRRSFGEIIKSIQETRISVLKEAPIPAINAAAAPVCDHAGTLVCALTIVGRSDSFDVGPASRAIAALHEAAVTISRNDDFVSA